MPRLFVAIGLADTVRKRLAGYLEECRAASPEVRWVPAANLHITLRFLGRVDDATAVRGRLAGVRSPAFEARLAGAGSFRTRGGHVAWLGVAEGREPLTRLAAAVEAAVQLAGLPVEPLRFRPHLTLGRTPGPVQVPPAPELPAWRVDRFALFESRLGAGPPVYTVVEEFRLEA